MITEFINYKGEKVSLLNNDAFSLEYQIKKNGFESCKVIDKNTGLEVYNFNSLGEFEIKNYDSNNNLIFSKNSNSVCEYFYDQHNNIISKITYCPEFSRYYNEKKRSYYINIYDELNRLIKTKNEDTITKIEYLHENSLIIKTIYSDDGDNSKIISLYDSNLIEVAKSIFYEDSNFNNMSLILEYESDPLILMDKEDGVVFNYEYNNYNKLIKITTSEGNEEVIKYDAHGNKVKVMYNDSVFIEYIYDDKNNLIKEINQHDSTLCYEYDNKGRLIKKMDNEEVVLIKDFDSLNNLIYSNVNNIEEWYKYDENNTLRFYKYKEEDYEIIKNYDLLGRLFECIYNDGDVMQLTYHENYIEIKLYQDDKINSIERYDYEFNMIYKEECEDRTIIKRQFDNCSNIVYENYSYDDYYSETWFKYDNLFNVIYEKKCSNNTDSYNEIIYDYDIYRNVIYKKNTLIHFSTVLNYIEEWFTYVNNVLVSSKSKSSEASEEYNEYNKFGDITYTKSSDDSLMINEYDEEGNLISEYIKECDGSEQWSKFDLNNNKIYYKNHSKINEFNDEESIEEFWYTFDKNGRISSSKDINGLETFYKYDKEDREIYSINSEKLECWTSYEGESKTILKRYSSGLKVLEYYDYFDSPIWTEYRILDDDEVC